jgi:Caspase domain
VRFAAVKVANGAALGTSGLDLLDASPANRQRRIMRRIARWIERNPRAGTPLRTALLWAWGLVLAAGPFSADAKRVALVIGNDSYQNAQALSNARSDAKAKALETSGFSVTLKQDLTLKSMKEALRTFKAEVAGGDDALFYFSGHGVQFEGSNYLIPVDVVAQSEERGRRRSGHLDADGSQSEGREHLVLGDSRQRHLRVLVHRAGRRRAAQRNVAGGRGEMGDEFAQLGGRGHLSSAECQHLGRQRPAGHRLLAPRALVHAKRCQCTSSNSVPRARSTAARNAVVHHSLMPSQRAAIAFASPSDTSVTL